MHARMNSHSVSKSGCVPLPYCLPPSKLEKHEELLKRKLAEESDLLGQEVKDVTQQVDEYHQVGRECSCHDNNSTVKHTLCMSGLVCFMWLVL